MKPNQHSSGQIGKTDAMIMELLGGLCETQDLPAFKRTAEAMIFDGTTASVVLSLQDASVKIYCKGQEESVYESSRPSLCKSIEFADQLGMEAVSEMIVAASEQSEKGRALVLAKIANRPW